MAQHVRGRWKKKKTADPADPSEPAPRRRKPRRGTRRLWLLGAGLLVVVVLWLLPAIVAHTPLFGWVVGRATAELNGSVSIGSASLGWLSPVRLGRIEALDANQETVFQADELTTTKPLAELLLNWDDLGTIHIKNARLALVARDDGSNLEDLLAEYLKRESSDYQPAFQIELSGGSATLKDLPTGQAWQFDNVQLLCARPPANDEPWRIEAAAQVGRLGGAESARGKLHLAGQFRPPTSALSESPSAAGQTRAPVGALAAQTSSGPAAGPPAAEDRPAAEDPPAAEEDRAAAAIAQAQGAERLTATIEAERLPLAVLRPLLARVMYGARLSGEACGKAEVRWPESAASPRAVDAQLVVDDFSLGAASLGDDRIWLPRFEGECRMQGKAGVLQIGVMQLECELGEISAQGNIRLEQFFADQRWWEKLINQDLLLAGRVDLARLAATLPHTLRIRKDIQITGGKLVFGLTSRPQAPTPGWQARLATTGLRANHAGGELVWEKPIELTVSARHTAQGPVVDELLCQSEFLQVRAVGNLKDAALAATFDLDKLAAQLGRFVDLGETHLAGQGWTHLDWKHQSDGQATAEAEFQLRDLNIQSRGRSLLAEPELVAFLSAGLETDLRSRWRLLSASLEVQADGDLFKARLIEPPAELSTRVPWKLLVEAHSRLSHWPTRLAGWWHPEYRGLDGTGALTGRLIVGPEQLRLEQADVRLADLRFDRGSLHLAEPQAELAFSATWQRSDRRVQLAGVQLTSATADLQADALSVRLPEAGWPAVEGTVNYRVDTARLAGWWADPQTPPAWNTAGRLTGSARLKPAQQATTIAAEADLTDLALVHRSGFKWQEPLVHADLQGRYQPDGRLLEIASLKLAASSLAAQAAGRLTATGTSPARTVSVSPDSAGTDQMLLVLDGRVGYDWARLTPLLQAGLGPGVKIEGQFTSPANWQGPLDPAEARAEAELQWQRANLYGFLVGPGTCRAHLGEGMLLVDPMELAVNQGRLLLAPKVQFEPQPALFTLPAGPLVDRVQVTPEMCAAALQYVAPVLANATSVQGLFSIELDQCSIPLERPAMGRMAGRMTIHSMEVGPGPLIQELAVALGRATPGRLRHESVIRFVMVDGGVHHDGLELEFPEVTIRTRGFVGFDRSLNLMVEMPIPEKWLVGPRVRAALANKTITLPIAGTLSRPRLDRRALQEANRRVLREAARDAVENEVLNQLNRLFGPPQ